MEGCFSISYFEVIKIIKSKKKSQAWESFIGLPAYIEYNRNI